MRTAHLVAARLAYVAALMLTPLVAFDVSRTTGLPYRTAWGLYIEGVRKTARTQSDKEDSLRNLFQAPAPGESKGSPKNTCQK
jgi:hypothetical protein